jgi:mRNA interferase MazF
VATVLRGEIHWAELDPVRGHEQSGRRPVLVLSHAELNSRGIAICLPITSRPPAASFPLTHEIRGAKMPRRSWVLIHQIRVLSTERIVDKCADLPEEEVESVIDGLLHLIR